MTTVGGRYELESTLGRGGAATVWLASDLHTATKVAVKLLDPDEGGGAARRDRLRREARLLATLEHPNVVRILDVGDHDDQPYLVMEVVPGGSLADTVRADGPMTPANAVRSVLGVLSALEAAHAIGVVHRDVKPGNVLLRADGTPVLCDFGIARTDGDAQTRTGVALGSMGYMAPEQRVDARKAGPPADVYGAACTLFNLVTADTPVDLYLAADSSPRWESVPAPLRPALRHATRPEPSARPLDAAQFAEELRSVLPALEGLPSVRPRAEEPVGYAPTRAAMEPSLQDKDRFVTSADWAARRGARVGRGAVWIAVILVGVVGVVAGSAPRWLSADERVVQEASDVAGRWVGTVDGWPAELTLTSGAAGSIVVDVDGAEVRSDVQAEVRRSGLELTETGTGAVWHGSFGQSHGVIEGRVRRAGVDVDFAFVHVRH